MSVNWLIVVLLALPVLIILWGVGVYNRLIALRNRIDNAWGQIDVQLKRRFDLIPNLVETVKGYAGHEKAIFDNIAESRAKMMSAQGVQEQAEAQNMLTGALKSLFAISEAYPDLKANQNFQQLQAELTQTEQQIARTREIYNDAVMTYNTMTEQLPNSVIANIGGFRQRAYFPVDEESKEPVKVSF